MSDTLRGQVKPKNQRTECDTGTCALCRRIDYLQTSHIIPKFINKWLNETSATGAMMAFKHRQGEYSDSKQTEMDVKIVQDAFNTKLLCGKCEQRFSKLEKQFAENIFHPFHKHGTKQLEYGSWLEPFAVSLSWRVLKSGYELFKSRYPDLITHVDKAEVVWRKSLLGDVWNAPPYESHLIFLDSMIGTGVVSDKFDYYMRRAGEYMIDCQFGNIFTYAKLPGMVFATAITPNILRGWQETRIMDKGVLANRHRAEIISPFWEYLQTRDFSDGGWLDAPEPHVPQKKLVKRFQKAYQKDPKKFPESDSIKIKTDQLLARYRQKMVEISPAVTDLFDKIVNCVADTQTGYVTDIWSLKKIFDALVELSVDEAAAFESGIQKAIQQLSATNPNTEYSLKANTIWIIFMANHNLTEVDHRAVIENRRSRITVERLNGNMPVVVWSMNYYDGDISFGFGVL